MHVNVNYPSRDAELSILRLARKEAQKDEVQPPVVITQEQLLLVRRAVLDLHLSEAVENYLVNLTCATRNAEHLDSELNQWIEFGVSPRATISLERCARAHAWLMGRDYVSPDDVQAVAHDVLRHRLILSFEAEANGITADTVIDRVLSLVAVE